MPSPRNIQQLTTLKEKLASVKSIVFVNHKGLKVSEQQELRRKLKAENGDFLVAKNTLLSLALEQTQNSKLRTQNLLTGPSSVVLSYHDEILPIKILAKFSKEHEKPVIKGGFLGDQPLTNEEVLKISQLPNKEELLGQLLRQMQAPMVGMVHVLNGNIEKFVWVLANIKDQISLRPELRARAKIKNTN